MSLPRFMRDARRAPLYIILNGQSVMGRMLVFRVCQSILGMGWSMLRSVLWADDDGYGIMVSCCT